MSSFASDLSSGYTAAYTFLEPNYGWITSNYEDGSSQHPQDSVAGGEGLIQTVYEAIRNSPVWPNSLLIITYDEHGGFYDSVAPVAGVPPNDGSNNSSLNEYGFQFDQLGVRVPAVIVSPWIPAGTVCSNQFDHTSVLATVERLFGVNPLTARDQAANDVLSLLTETSARTDCPVTIPAAQPVSALPLATEESVRDRETGPIPERGTLPGFLAIAHKLHRELAAGTGEDISAIQDRFQALRTRAEARAYIEDVLSRLPGSAAVTA
jgi:phospholipase C